MKIFGLLNNYDVTPLPDSGIELENETSISLLYFPDVALLASGKPFFIPPGNNEWEVYPSAAVRISRLGKSISAKFASRYYKEAAFGFNFRNMTLLDNLRRLRYPWTEAVGTDYSTPLGHFMPAEKLLNSDAKISICLTDRNGTLIGSTMTYSPSLLSINTDHAIEVISRRFTLKDGDIIFLGFPNKGIPIGKAGSIYAELADEPLIITKIK